MKTLFGFAAAFIILEITLRILGYGSGRVYIYDSVLVGKLKPNNKFIWKKQCFKAKIITNSQGFHDAEHSLQKAKLRVAFIGDSFLEALQVELNKTFYRLLQSNFHELEIMAFGLSGAGTFQHYLIYKNYVEKYKPDFVFIMFYPSNDISDSSLNMQLKLYEKSLDSRVLLKPFPILYKSSYSIFYHRAVEEYRKKEMIKNILSLSAIYGFLRSIDIYSILGKIKSKFLNKKTITFEVVEEIKPTQVDYKIFEFFTKKMKEEIKNIIFIVIPDNREITQSYNNEIKKEALKILKRNKVPYYDMTQYFKERFGSENKLWYYECDGHWNEVGHSWANDFIKNLIIQEVINK